MMLIIITTPTISLFPWVVVVVVVVEVDDAQTAEEGAEVEVEDNTEKSIPYVR